MSTKKSARRHVVRRNRRILNASDDLPTQGTGTRITHHGWGAGLTQRAYRPRLHPAEEHDEDDVIVTCACCAKTFPGIAPTQAYGCAADLSARGVTGHYGSEVCDLEFLPFTHADHGCPERGQICDTCIRAMLEDGTLGKPQTLDVFEGANS